MIRFNKKAWIKPYIDMKNDQRKKWELTLKKKVKLMSNVVFGKTLEEFEKYIEILNLSL